jgi:hypothetical protein
MAKIGWAVGVCPKCGRVYRREYPADLAICDCYRYCEICGSLMTPYTPDMNPRTYRSEDVDDPTGSADKHEATVRTRYYCAKCDVYSDGVPVEVELR